MESREKVISDIRQFNRFYTNILGLLDKHVFDTEYSLTEARVMMEIGRQENCIANNIVNLLKLDRSYMSRILAKFEKDGLIERTNSNTDSRKSLLNLTKKGKEEFTKLDDKSNEQIANLVSKLCEKDLDDIHKAMGVIEYNLNKIEKSNKCQKSKIEIRAAYDEVNNVKQLFEEYSNSLGVDLKFQNYDEEINSLPGKYAMPNGRLYLAFCNSKLAGCIGLRKLDESNCEMKRLYVRPEFRGMKIGELLSKQIIEDARGIGYKAMYLDTLSTLESAVYIYKKWDFRKLVHIIITL